jgi:omega-6 fatty acid desaturase (delta-12 desaturase)
MTSAEVRRPDGPLTPAHFTDLPDRAALRAHVARYARADDRRAGRALASTFAGYAASLLASTFLVDEARDAPDLTHRVLFGLASALAVVALASAMFRAFLLHHDLCHGRFFSSRALCRLVAPVAGTLVSTSSSLWTREHDRHHRDSNNLDRPQDGQTAGWTVDRYQRAPGWQRWLYYLVNRPVVLFLLVPPLYFLGFQRLRARLHENLLFLAFALALAMTGAWLPFLLALALASSLGFLVFHASHTFDGVVRRRGPSWDFVENALAGSSFLVVPERGLLGAWLRWALFSLQYHHVHHLHPGVPAYHLAACHREAGAMFDDVRRVTVAEALRSTRYTLFDERTGTLVTFAGHQPWKRRARR